MTGLAARDLVLFLLGAGISLEVRCPHLHPRYRGAEWFGAPTKADSRPLPQLEQTHLRKIAVTKTIPRGKHDHWQEERPLSKHTKKWGDWKKLGAKEMTRSKRQTLGARAIVWGLPWRGGIGGGDGRGCPPGPYLQRGWH